MSSLSRRGWVALVAASLLTGLAASDLKAQGELTMAPAADAGPGHPAYVLRTNALLSLAQPVQTMEVTAYCLRGRTASGAWVGPGIAAAARGVPFGTQLHVAGIGSVVVADRGGAIYGNRLDVWMECAAAWQWGRRWVAVTWEGAA